GLTGGDITVVAMTYESSFWWHIVRNVDSQQTSSRNILKFAEGAHDASAAHLLKENSLKWKVTTKDAHDVFEAYSVFCARNVRRRRLVDLPWITTFDGFRSEETTKCEVFRKYTNLYTIGVTTRRAINPSASLYAEEGEEEEAVENVYDETANLFPNKKSGGSSSFTDAAVVIWVLSVDAFNTSATEFGTNKASPRRSNVNLKKENQLEAEVERMPRSGIESEQWDHLLDSLRE
nr:protein kinase, catalytic domain-containing protein [Tanacetum cinerariifolium]